MCMPVHCPCHNPLARIVWEQTALPVLLHSVGADLVHGLVNVVPLAVGMPSVVTVHDLSFLRMPDKFPAGKAHLSGPTVPRQCGQSQPCYCRQPPNRA